MTAKILPFHEPVYDADPGAFDWPGAPDPDNEDGHVLIVVMVFAAIFVPLAIVLAVRWGMG